MTVLTLRYQRRHFTVSGPDIEMRKFERDGMPGIGAPRTTLGAITGFPAPPAEQGPGTACVESLRSCLS